MAIFGTRRTAGRDPGPEHTRPRPSLGPSRDVDSTGEEESLIVYTSWTFPIHQLRCASSDFESFASGAKVFDIRSADHHFGIGDLILYRHWHHEYGYTGDTCVVRVCTVLVNHPALVPGFAVVGLARDIGPDVVTVAGQEEVRVS